MQKLRIVADVFSPEAVKTIIYSGKHPSRALKIIPTLLKETFKITSTKFFEDNIRWDKSSDPIEFFAQWRGRDEKDGRTSIWIKVKIIGKQNSKDKNGKLNIYIHPYLVTKLPYSNIFDKILTKFYYYFFYGNQKKKYISEELVLLKRFEDKLKAEFEMK